MPKKKGTVELRVFVPQDLRNKFKSSTAVKGFNMSETLTALIKSYLLDEFKPEEGSIGTSQLRIFIPAPLRQNFKGKCAENQTNMSRVITGLMQGFVDGTITVYLDPEDGE